MRFFCALMIYASPILLAPYWRSFCADQDEVYISGRSTVDPGCAAGYFNCVLYTVVLMTLYSVTMEIEDIWDGNGNDDICYTHDLRFEEATRRETRHELRDGRVHISYSDALGANPSAFLQGDEEGRFFPSTHLVTVKPVMQPLDSVLVRSYSNRLVIPSEHDAEDDIESHAAAQ